MQGAIPAGALVLALGAAVTILVAYAAALWFFLRHESIVALLALLALCGFSLSARLVYTDDYPPGLNLDEPSHLQESVWALQRGEFFGVSGIQIPVLLGAVFEAPLIPIIGANRWTIRLYSLVTGVLAIPAAFAVGRAMNLAVVPSFGIAAFTAFLPWSLHYGRLSQGGELIFHELLLIAALARLVWQHGRWGDVGIGGFALCLLLYDYWCGRAMLALPFLAAALAPRRQRVLCLAVFALGVLGWVPYLMVAPAWYWFGVGGRVTRGLAADPLGVLARNVLNNFRMFVTNAGRNDWMTMSTGGIHPIPALALGVLGILSPTRRSVFLAGAFVIGLVPSVLSWGSSPSAHRMLMAFPVVAIAGGCALELTRKLGRTRANALSVAAIALVSVQSVRLFFSPEFWRPENLHVFAPDKVAVVEALPPSPHPHLIVDRNLHTAFYGQHALVDANHELLTVNNFTPPETGDVVYAFEEHAAALQSFYLHLLGQKRVRIPGQGFIVTFEAGDWTWLRNHGWRFAVDCTQTQWHGHALTLHYTNPSDEGQQCSRYAWRGTWRGAPRQMRLRFRGRARVETAGRLLASGAGEDQLVEFWVEPDMPLTIILSTSREELWIALFEVTPAGERVPAFESVDPATE